MNKIKWLTVFWITILLVGCGSLPAANNVQTTEIVPFTRQVTSSPTSSPTQEPEPKLTQMMTNTPKPIQTEQVGECRLPCWWGITPGVTTWDAAYKILEKLKSPSSEIEVYDPAMSSKMPEGGYVGMTHDGSGIIDAIGISTSYANGVEHYDLLTEYGEPSDVYLFAYQHFQGEYPPASVILYYAGEGILAEYEFAAKLDETTNIITVCPISAIQKIHLKPKGTALSFDEIRNFVMGISDFPMLKIVDATTMTKHDFYLKYKDKNQTGCFETSSSLWP